MKCSQTRVQIPNVCYGSVSGQMIWIHTEDIQNCFLLLKFSFNKKNCAWCRIVRNKAAEKAKLSGYGTPSPLPPDHHPGTALGRHPAYSIILPSFITVPTPHPTRSQHCRADPARSPAESLARPTPPFVPANVSGPLILARVTVPSAAAWIPSKSPNKKISCKKNENR